MHAPLFLMLPEFFPFFIAGAGWSDARWEAVGHSGGGNGG